MASLLIIGSVYQHCYGHPEGDTAKYGYSKNEAVEGAVVPLGDAGARPGTVVVEPLYTIVARGAMLGSWRSIHVASLTELPPVRTSRPLLHLLRSLWFDVSWDALYHTGVDGCSLPERIQSPEEEQRRKGTPNEEEWGMGNHEGEEEEGDGEEEGIGELKHAKVPPEHQTPIQPKFVIPPPQLMPPEGVDRVDGEVR